MVDTVGILILAVFFFFSVSFLLSQQVVRKYPHDIRSIHYPALRFQWLDDTEPNLKKQIERLISL
jgi:hypothetical protein